MPPAKSLVVSCTSDLSQKFVEEVSPQSGRKNLAHGVSRGSVWPPSPPSPLPPARERGAEGGVRATFPTAYAMGRDLTPLTGLGRNRPHVADFINELLTQGTWSARHEKLSTSHMLPSPCCLPPADFITSA